jgi:hypothetical protein
MGLTLHDVYILAAVEDSAHVANALLNGLLGHPIGEPLSALVEYNHARERREPLSRYWLGGNSPSKLVRMGQWRMFGVAPKATMSHQRA